MGKLVLTRKIGQSITIGDEDIIITLSNIINSNQAQLTFSADKNKTEIWRSEVFEQRKKEKKNAK